MKKILPVLALAAVALAGCGGAAAKSAQPAPATAAPATTAAPTTTVAPTTTTVAPTTTTQPRPVCQDGSHQESAGSNTCVPDECPVGQHHPRDNPYICLDDLAPVPTTAVPAVLGTKANPYAGGVHPDYCLSAQTPKGLCDYWSKIQVEVRTPAPSEIRAASRSNPTAPEGQHWVEIGFIGTSVNSLHDAITVRQGFKLVGDKGTLYDEQNTGLEDPNDKLFLVTSTGGMVGGNVFFLVDDDDANLVYAHMKYNSTTDTKTADWFMAPTEVPA